MDINEFGHRKLKRKTSKFWYIVLFVVIIVGMYFADNWLNKATDRYIDYRVQQELNK